MEKKCIVASCVIIKGNKTLLLNHKKLRVWMYPGGHIDGNETPTEAAIREAREETGFKVSLISKNLLPKLNEREVTEPARPILTLYETVPYSTGTHMHFDLIYLAKAVGGRKRPARGESRELKWVSEADIKELRTFENVKHVLNYAFKVMRENNC